MTERRRFIAKATSMMAAIAAAAVVEAPNVIAQPKVQWRMSTVYPPAPHGIDGETRGVTNDQRRCH